MNVFGKIFTALTLVFSTLFPCFDYSPKSDDVLLNVSIISDVHIDHRLPCGKFLLKRAFVDMNKNTAGDDVAVVVGDLTNYGDEASIEDFFEILTKNCNAENKVIAMGNHDIGHVSDLGYTNQEARDWFLRHHNEYLGTDFEHNYYTIDAKGYKFIVLCDDSEDNWDRFEFYDEQLAFLDSELAKATADGLPAFVVCHEPLEGVNGQNTIWKDGSIRQPFSDSVRTILEKYKNVFYISGHMHAGINGSLTKSVLGFECVEKINGVTYVNLPTYLLVNRYGIPWNGTGMQMEVYENQVVFRARNFLESKWYSQYEYTIELEK